MPSLMVWSTHCRRSGSQYINQDVDKVRHPTYRQVPAVCITIYPKNHSVIASSSPKKMESAGCFPVCKISDSSNCLQRTVPVTWTQFPYRALHFNLHPASLLFGAVAVGFTFQAWPTIWGFTTCCFGTLLLCDQPLNGCSVCLHKSDTTLISAVW